LKAEYTVTWIQMSFVLVRGTNKSVELPLELDGRLAETTLQIHFPNALGLQYRPPNKEHLRAVKLEIGFFVQPDGGWGDSEYIAVERTQATQEEWSQINVAEVTKLAVMASNRTDIEYIANNFVKRHYKDHPASCSNWNSNTTSGICRHIEICPVLGDRSGLPNYSFTDFRSQNIPVPSEGTLKRAFAELSHEIHTVKIIKTKDRRNILIAGDLPAAEKRLLIRYHLSRGYHVKVVDDDGLRDPIGDEVTTPEKKKENNVPASRCIGKITSSLDDISATNKPDRGSGDSKGGRSEGVAAASQPDDQSSQVTNARKQRRVNTQRPL